MRAVRKTDAYQAVMIDLFLIGALEQEVVEKLIGNKIPEYLVSPLDGKVAPTTDTSEDEINE
jgi:hypothetical protein